MWDSIERSSLSVIQIDKWEEFQVNGIEQIFKKIIEKLPKPGKDMLLVSAAAAACLCR